ERGIVHHPASPGADQRCALPQFLQLPAAEQMEARVLSAAGQGCMQADDVRFKHCIQTDEMGKVLIQQRIVAVAFYSQGLQAAVQSSADIATADDAHCCIEEIHTECGEAAEHVVYN